MSIQYGLISEKQIDAFLPLMPNHQELLGESDVFAVGAVTDGQACGILVFRSDELTADILYLAVAESHRRKGIANCLIDFLCESAWKTSTAVLCTFSATDRNDALCRLMVKRGDFTLAEAEGYICRFPCEKLKMIQLDTVPPSGSQIESFYKLPEYIRNDFFSRLKEGEQEFARSLQEERGLMLEPLCLCVVESGLIQAAIFCQSQGGDVLLSFAYACTGHTRGLIALLSRLRVLLVRAANKVPYLHIAAVTPESRKLVDTLLPQREITSRFYTACWDMNTMGG